MSIGPDKERLLELADHLDTLEHFPYTSYPMVEEEDQRAQFSPGGFNLARYYYSCGSPACVAGHAEKLYPLPEGMYLHERVEGTRAFHAGKFALGLTREQAEQLFVPDLDFYPGSSASTVTPQMAARVLRTFAREGVISYKRAWDEEVAAGE